jgi:hypothetical protein
MTDTPAESAEDPRTPEVYAAAIRSGDDPLVILRLAIAEALTARNAEWREAVTETFGPLAMEMVMAGTAANSGALRALLTEGKPGK